VNARQRIVYYSSMHKIANIPSLQELYGFCLRHGAPVWMMRSLEILYKRGNCDKLEAMLPCEICTIIPSRHESVLIPYYFTNYRCRLKTRQATQICSVSGLLSLEVRLNTHWCLRVSTTFQYSTFLVSKRENVARSSEYIAICYFWISQLSSGQGSVVGGYPGRCSSLLIWLTEKNAAYYLLCSQLIR